LKNRVASAVKLGFSPSHARVLARLDTPEKIQDYLDRMSINHERNGDTCLAAAGALRLGACHCIEGALIGASALWLQGQPPLLLDLKAKNDDITSSRCSGAGVCGARSQKAIIWFCVGVIQSTEACANWRCRIFHEYTNGAKKTLRQLFAAIRFAPL